MKKLYNHLSKALKNAFSFNTSLKAQLISVLVAISIVPMALVGIITYKSTNDNITLEKTNTLKAYSEGILGSIETQMESAGNLIKGISSQSDITVVMENYNRGADSQVDPGRKNAIEMSLKNVVESSEKLYETVYIADIKGRIVLEGSKHHSTYIDQQFYDMKDFETLKSSNKMLIGNPIKSKATGIVLLPVSRPVKSLAGFMGVMTIMFDLEKLTAGYNNTKPGTTGEVVVINSENNTIFNTDNKLINTTNDKKKLEELVKSTDAERGFITYDYNGKTKNAYYIKSGLTGWLICAQLDMREFMAPVDRLRNFTVWMLVALVILSVLVSVGYSGYLSRPIMKLVGLMKQVEKGDLNININFKSVISEINELKTGFADMTGNLKKIINGVKDAALQVTDTTASMASASQSSLSHAEDTVSAVSDITGSIQRQAESTDIVARNIEPFRTASTRQRAFRWKSTGAPGRYTPRRKKA